MREKKSGFPLENLWIKHDPQDNYNPYVHEAYVKVRNPLSAQSPPLVVCPLMLVHVTSGCVSFVSHGVRKR